MEEKHISIQEIRESLIRRKWTIALTAFLVVAAVGVHTYMQPPQYVSGSVMMLETVNVGLQSMNPDARGTTTKPIGFYQAILRSGTLNRALLQKAMSDSLIVARARALNLSVDCVIGESISLTAPNYLNFIELRVVTPDPDLSYRIAIHATEHLKNQSQRIDEEQARNEIDYLEAQLATTKSSLENAEASLQEFREKSSVKIGENNDGLVERLVELETELTKTQTQRELAESNFESYKRRLESQFSHPGDIDSEESPQVAQLKSELAALQTRYDELLQGSNGSNGRATALQGQIEGEKQELIDALLRSRAPKNGTNAGSATLLSDLEKKVAEEEINIYALRNREQYYRRLIENFRKSHPNLLDNAIEMSRLMREKTVLEELYTFLLERSEEAKIRAATGTGGIRIIDPANRPSSPMPADWVQRILLALFSGLVFGCGVAYLRESFDQTVKSNEEVIDRLGLTMLGVVPEHAAQKQVPVLNGNGSGSPATRDGNGKDLGLVYGVKSRSPITEAFRSIRTNLQYALADQQLQVMLVTSGAPKDGKSFVALNLAAAYAESGKRVLLVDGDLRKPRQHKLLNSSKTPGLTNLVVKGLPPVEVIRSTHVHGLDFLSCGSLPPNPAEIIGSKSMDLFFQLMRKEYDHIIVDSPPVGAVADPLVAGQLADGVIFVVRHEVTNRNLARGCVERLQQVKARIVGAIMNGAAIKPGYGYYKYYNYAYNYYAPENGVNGVNGTAKRGTEAADRKQ